MVGQLQDASEVPAWPDVIYPGYVGDDVFDSYLAAADFPVQLRHPTLGETSHVITKLIASGRTVVISDTPYTREFPDRHVVRLRPDDDEVPGLVRAFDLLAARPARRDEFSYDPRHTPQRCADEVARVLLGQHQAQRLIRAD